MSQNVVNTGLPTPATTQDWTTVLDKAIQSASNDDKETADAKYAKCQCWKQAKKEHKVAEEVAAHARAAQAEAEHWEKECWEKEELEDNQEMNRWSKMLVVDRLRVSAPVGDRPGMSVPVLAETGNPGPAEGLKAKGKAKACDLVPVGPGPCAWCVRAGVECMFKLARAIMAAIDWHTSKMVKHREITKVTQHTQRQFNNHLYELLQEMEYQQVAEVGESSDEESTGIETSNRETNKDAEGEEAPESDPEGYHKMKTESQ
ncbi:hypothetical protein EDC04DRAFT_2611518 [Pisolithus marmoratus]|nr:hypothetical protein EDC04DRAFT_2611518 [Pisolithus marmoratus]